MAAERSEIHDFMETWIKAVNAGDIARLLTMVTDDVVLVGPGGAPFGREVFEATFTGAHKELVINCASEVDDVVIAGDVAYSVCHDSLSVTPRAGGAATRLAGHRVTVYRKGADGRWRLARDAHTLQPVT
ncbi:YybH family protein [Pseudoduganella sp. OTU4001]|uniref:YybH family protein n=1 Tax=Pseudoduganella sp. OTU4001 TaxID=3043854 RepID=UPI00313D8DCA